VRFSLEKAFCSDETSVLRDARYYEDRSAIVNKYYLLTNYPEGTSEIQAPHRVGKSIRSRREIGGMYSVLYRRWQLTYPYDMRG
jgi:hypothetical protein